MGETREDHEHWTCEWCDMHNKSCVCPNGPWNDIDEVIKWLSGERERLTTEIKYKNIDLNRCNSAFRQLESDVVEIQGMVTKLFDVTEGALHEQLGHIIAKCCSAL